MRILFVDDSESDVQLLLRRLRVDGIEAEHRRVAAEAPLREACTGERWDIALVDYNIPGFAGLAAMAVITELTPDTPMITVSGAIDEDTAVATLTSGAVDYVLKDNLTRLAPAVRRAIAGAETRRDLRHRSEEARTSKFALDHSSFPVVMALEDGTVTYANAAAAAISGLAEAHFVGSKIWDTPISLSEAGWADAWRGARERSEMRIERAIVDQGGDERLLDMTMNFIEREGVPLVVTYVRDVTAERRAREDERRATERLRESLEGTMVAMAQIVETRDPYTAGHERRVAALTAAIAAQMGWEGDELENLRIAASVHDIGKIAVPTEILTKPGRLSAPEFSLIREHAQAGYDILAGISFEGPVAELVLQHHERLDGSGYPRGLSADEIMSGARILCVADVVEAMSSHRPYRPSRGIDEALAEIESGAGRLYDPDVVTACLRVVRESGFEFDD